MPLEPIHDHGVAPQFPLLTAHQTDGVVSPSFHLSGWTSLAVQASSQAIQVTARPIEDLTACVCGGTSFFKHGALTKRFTDLPLEGKPVEIIAIRQRYRCKQCGTTGLQPVPGIHEGYTVTGRLARYVAVQSETRPFVEVAQEVGLDEKTVRTIFEDHAATLTRLAQPDTPRVLGIHPVQIHHRPRWVLTNMEAGTLLDILPSASSLITPRVLTASLGDPGKVELVCAQPDNQTIQAVKDALPQAMIVVDPASVSSMALTALDQTRREIQTALSDRKRRPLMHCRHLLARRNLDLTAHEQRELETCLAGSPLLQQSYEAKEVFLDLFAAPNTRTAIDRYAQWRRTLPPPVVPFYQPLLRAVTLWGPEVFASLDHPFTNRASKALSELVDAVNHAPSAGTFHALRTALLFTQGVRKMGRTGPLRHADSPENLMSQVLMKPPSLVDLGADMATLTLRYRAMPPRP